MKVQLQAFGGKLKSDIQELPEVKSWKFTAPLPVYTSKIMDLDDGMYSLTNYKTFEFKDTGNYTVLPNGECARIFELKW